MLKEKTHITITQKGDGRSDILFFDFCNQWEFSDNWEDLSAQGKITFPKNIYFLDLKTNKLKTLFGVSNSINNVFRRGDAIKIESRYVFWDESLNEKQTKKVTICEGYITKVNAKMPIELEFENDMYLLKQIPMTNQSFKSTQKLEDILQTELDKCNDKFGTDFKVNKLTGTTLKFDNCLLTAENESVAQFLARLRKDYFLRCYFRGNELRIGSIVYIESEAKTKTFEFQNNIISSDLIYSRKDDVVLSAVASNHIIEETGSFAKDGQPKTRNRRIEVLVTLKDNRVITKIVKKGDKADPNVEGERRSLTYPFAKTEQELIDLATEDLKKYYYTGFKGKFTTFGTPYVQFGDNAKLVNKIIPDNDGVYKIKGVEYSGGVGGYRQIIELDYKVLL